MSAVGQVAKRPIALAVAAAAISAIVSANTDVDSNEFFSKQFNDIGRTLLQSKEDGIIQDFEKLLGQGASILGPGAQRFFENNGLEATLLAGGVAGLLNKNTRGWGLMAIAGAMVVAIMSKQAKIQFNRSSAHSCSEAKVDLECTTSSEVTKDAEVATDSALTEETTVSSERTSYQRPAGGGRMRGRGAAAVVSLMFPGLLPEHEIRVPGDVNVMKLSPEEARERFGIIPTDIRPPNVRGLGNTDVLGPAGEDEISTRRGLWEDRRTVQELEDSGAIVTNRQALESPDPDLTETLENDRE